MSVATLRCSPRRGATVLRALRCLPVSVGTTVLSATILVLLDVGGGVPAGTANVVAVVAVFATLWLVQFVLLDRVIFRSSVMDPDTSDGSRRDHHRSAA